MKIKIVSERIATPVKVNTPASVETPETMSSAEKRRL